jgi:hypothetical protein
MGNISEQRLRQLERAERKLNALESGGVDNWEWYSESLKDYFKEEELAELLDDSTQQLEEDLFSEPDFWNVEIPSVREAGYSVYLTEDGQKFLRQYLESFKSKIDELNKN